MLWGLNQTIPVAKKAFENDSNHLEGREAPKTAHF
jgi:hypothetical protein